LAATSKAGIRIRIALPNALARGSQRLASRLPKLGRRNNKNYDRQILYEP